MKLTPIPGAAQVRIRTVTNKRYNEPNAIKSYSVPAWILPTITSSLHQALGGKPAHPTILHSRIAAAMGVRDGDYVELEFVEAQQRCKVPVTTRDGIPTALLIHGAVDCGIVQSSTAQEDGETLLFPSGNSLQTKMQTFWAALRLEPPRMARAILEFHATSSACGFCVRLANRFGQPETDDSLLIQGHIYIPVQTPSIGTTTAATAMLYKGLIEGLWWALRCHIQTLWVRGDSQRIINQCHGTEVIKDPTEQEYHDDVLALIEQAEKKGVTCIVEHIPQESNPLAQSLAMLGSCLHETAIAVHWEACNRL